MTGIATVTAVERQKIRTRHVTIKVFHEVSVVSRLLSIVTDFTERLRRCLLLGGRLFDQERGLSLGLLIFKDDARNRIGKLRVHVWFRVVIYRCKKKSISIFFLLYENLFNI
jgi:hypothetical protein